MRPKGGESPEGSATCMETFDRSIQKETTNSMEGYLMRTKLVVFLALIVLACLSLHCKGELVAVGHMTASIGMSRSLGPRAWERSGVKQVLRRPLHRQRKHSGFEEPPPRRVGLRVHDSALLCASNSGFSLTRR